MDFLKETIKLPKLVNPDNFTVAPRVKLLKKLKTPQVPKKWNLNVIILVLFVVFFIFFAYNCKYGMFKIEDSEIFYFSS